MSLIVTGTGIGVGKTFVSALIAHRYGHRGGLAYWKPVASGSHTSRDAREVQRLAGDSVTVLPEAYAFPDLSPPHVAGRLCGRSVEPRTLSALWRAHSRTWPAVVIEGIGGLLVPLNDEGYLLADWVSELKTPCLLVASSLLGTINHTLLSLEAMRRRDINVVGVVLNGPTDPENRRSIERFGQVAVVAEVAPIGFSEPLAISTLAQTFDLAGVLKPHLVGS